jgi:hypothetical protein
MTLRRPRTALKSGHDPSHVLHPATSAPPDQSEAPRSNSLVLTQRSFALRLRGCRHLMVTVSMELSVLRTSIKIQPMYIKTNPTPLSRA